jgi:protein-tyrosine phosphatase
MIRALFGSRKGLLRLLGDELAWHSLTERVAPVAWPYVRRLVFVCRGNICRSALSAEVARSLGAPAVSFGLETERGKPADPGMLAAARHLGFALEGHRTSPIADYAPLDGDLLAVYELGQLQQLRARLPEADIRPLGRWARPPRAYIHDPYGNTPEYYDRSCRLIAAATTALVREYQRAAATGSAP